jgi:hypothetical protein
VNRGIEPLLERLNARPFQKLPGSRLSAFAELDRPALLPLPTQRYELARFKTVKVHIDYHVEVERCSGQVIPDTTIGSFAAILRS